MDKRFNRLPLMGILRGIKEDEIEFIAEIASALELPAVEITMNTDGAASLIRKLSDAARGRFRVGAGTVLTLPDLMSALDAGASFIVMPTLISEIVRHCISRDIPVFPGALTPQEIFHAWREGATMVKVFPSGVFGPSYFKEIKGPFDKIPLMACGGVTPENIGEFFRCGATAASFGASIFRRDWIEQRDDKSIRHALTRLIQGM